MNNAIFIISYKRPKCKTIKALLSCGYSGEWYIIADDLDNTDYEKLYPEHVLRFSKSEYMDKVDAIDNFHKPTSSVYSRNACFDFAEKMGLDCFGLFDDDIKSFNIRYIEDGKLKSKDIKNFDVVFNSYCKFIFENNFACGAFVSAGRLIGGAQNGIAKEKFHHIPTNAYIINSKKKQIRFFGTLRDDSLYCYSNNAVGNMCYSFMPVVFNMEKPRNCKDGGMAETYEELGENWIIENYNNIAMPSFFKWKSKGNESIFKSDIPKILNQRWQK